MGFQNFPGGIQFGSRVYCFNPIDPLTFQRYTDTNRMTTTYLDSSNSDKAYIDVAGSSGQSVFTGATANSFNIGITDIATEIAFWINNNPKAYITQGPTYTFTVLGSAFAFTGSWIDGSDRRTKQNIEELAREKAISRIKALKTVEYDYIENNRHSIGFIAQDIQEIIPDAVMDGGKENMLGVAYNVVLSHLVPVVQHLLDENEKLKARLAKIEANGLLFA
jgi:hypothetical protein